MAASDLTAARLRELLNYNPETGLFTWRAAGHGVFAGAQAGWFGKRGYVGISVDRGTYQAHRLAWLYVHGEWPKQSIDHINGDKADNRLANLRDVSPRINAENLRQAPPTNKSGVLGVRKSRTEGKWEAWISFNGRTKYIGVYPTQEEAHAIYVAVKRVVHEGCTL